MKSLILYCSTHRRNTEKIAQIFAETIGSEQKNIKDIEDIPIEKYDLIGFGSGVYKESLSPKLIRLVDKLDLRGKNVFVFSTSGVGMKYYNNKLIKILEAKGAIIKGSFSCKGSFIAHEFTDNKIFGFFGKLSQGHPNDKDYKEAEKFIQTVVR